MSWCKLPVSLTELCLDTTLRCGQSFRWKKSEDNIWSCALHGRILSLRQDAAHLHYRALFPEALKAPLTPPSSAPPSADGTAVEIDDTEELVQHYLNLEPNLTELYEEWSSADRNFKKKAPKFTGVRILRQDAWEALVGFICSSNNNIIRISQMMEKLCVHYGPLIGHIDARSYYDMPSPARLTGSKVEGHLRELGFGYRAKYLHQTAIMITQQDAGWLDSLRNPESPVLGHAKSCAGNMLPGGREGYREAHEQLLALQGVGPKVADCVCLMGLGWGEAVPVDTHGEHDVLRRYDPFVLTRDSVWQIAQRDYNFGKGKHRSLTKLTYDAIGDHFRTLWGKEAGWAHSVLFTADLRAFSERLSSKTEVKEEIKEENGVGVVSKTVAKIEIKEEDGIGFSSMTIAMAELPPSMSVKRELDEESSLDKSENYTAHRKRKKQKGSVARPKR
ncbi:8-oxoguanine glycosylase ogg1 [Xylographa trunciseda]|nr:8-oxoguanine glycosylase ogg1 [Xylographa trunciseda]